MGQDEGMSYFDELRTLYAGPGKSFQHDSDESHWQTECPGCGSAVMRAVATGAYPKKLGEPRWDFSYDLPIDKAAWLYCPACGMGAFAACTRYHVVHKVPDKAPFGTPANLSPEVQHTWGEALNSYSASAYTACALMCRKLIFHMAVEAGLPAKSGPKDKAPGFEQCVDHLVDEEHITKKQKDRWVDSIRKWGNTATHDLAPTDQATAHKALQFTFQLLQMVYSFPGAAPGGPKEIDPAPEQGAITS